MQDRITDYGPLAGAEPVLEARELPNLWLGVSVESQKWARIRLVKLVATAGVPFFFKQWGQFAPESARAWVDSAGNPRGGLRVLDRAGGGWTRTPLLAPPDAVRMRRVGKGRARRVLDDRTWDEFPTSAGAGVVDG